MSRLARKIHSLLIALALEIIAFHHVAMAERLPFTLLTVTQPVGGRAGTTFELRLVGGEHLEGVDELLFSHPGITAEPKLVEVFPGGPDSSETNAFLVSIASDVPEGLYDVRAVGWHGVSNARTLAVDRLEPAADGVENFSMARAAPIAVEQVVEGWTPPATDKWYRLQLAAGRRITIELVARRVDSRLVGRLSLLDAQGRVAPHGRSIVDGDATIDFTPAEDGEYYIKLNDLAYHGGPEYFYRLRVTAEPRVDLVLPPVIETNQTSRHLVVGRNLGDAATPATARLDGRALEQFEVELPAVDVLSLPRSRRFDLRSSMLPAFDWRHVANGRWSNAARLAVATEPVLVEREPNDAPESYQRISPPCEIDGAFHPARDRDGFVFETRPNETWWIEVQSNRLTHPTDPSLVVRRVSRSDDGKTTIRDVAEADDQPNLAADKLVDLSSSDPIYKLNAQGGDYFLQLRDLFGDSRSDPRMVYRLIVRRATPDFRLAVLEADDDPANRRQRNPRDLSRTPIATHLRRGASAALRVFAERLDGFDGAIQVRAESLADGVTCSPVWIPAGAREATLILSASGEAATTRGPIRVVGTASLGGDFVERLATAGAIVWQTLSRNPPLTRDVSAAFVSVAAHESLPCQLRLGGGATNVAARGGKLSVPLTVTRRDGFNEKLTLTAMNLPQGVKAKALIVEADASQATLELEVAKDAALGPFSIHMEGVTKTTFAFGAAEVAIANAELAALERAAKSASATEAFAAALTAAKAKSTEAAGRAATRPAEYVLYSNSIDVEVVDVSEGANQSGT